MIANPSYAPSYPRILLSTSYSFCFYRNEGGLLRLAESIVGREVKDPNKTGGFATADAARIKRIVVRTTLGAISTAGGAGGSNRESRDIVQRKCLKGGHMIDHSKRGARNMAVVVFGGRGQKKGEKVKEKPCWRMPSASEPKTMERSKRTTLIPATWV